MNIIDIIVKKKNKEILTKEEIEYAINGYLKGEIKDYQMSSLLMAIVLNGMNFDETFYLTDVMLNSGEKIDLSSVEGQTVDKHSTGGVGDKTTLILAPLLASLGLKVAKMSGRGLGHTGGTIDKLESMANMSRASYIRHFEALNGKTLNQYLTKIRIKNASDLLLNTNLTITEISMRCGFFDSSHFSKIFKKYKGKLPLQYREENKKTLKINN